MDFAELFDEEFIQQATAGVNAEKEKRLQKDRNRPMPAPFKRPFPTEILTRIIQEVDYSTIPTCIRVSKQFFHIAGKIEYEDLVIDFENDPEAVMMGAEVTDPKAKGKKEADTKVEADETKPPFKPNFKRQLLNDRTTRSNLTKAARAMTGLRQAILSPDADFVATHPLCERNTCPIVSGLKPESITISNLQIDGLDDGPLELFTTAVNKAKHATLIIPPTSFYIGGRGGLLSQMSGRPEDLAYPTRHCESVRLIVGISEMEIMMLEYDHPVSLTRMEPLQEFLAAFINLNFTKIEIYIFNNFNDTLELPTFRQELATKVGKHYEDSIKFLTDSKRLEPKHSNWTANYQVFGLEDYFAIPKLHFEIDDYWMMEWVQELNERQQAKFEARKKAREEMLAQLEAEMSDSGSSLQEEPVDTEGEAIVADPEGPQEQGEVEGGGEKDQEGRPNKKAKV